MEFEWDENKNKSNQVKHGISFEEIIEIFDYPMLVKVDNRKDYGETRYIGVGRNGLAVLFTVVYTERKSRIRIISARLANKKERRKYGYS